MNTLLKQLPKNFTLSKLKAFLGVSFMFFLIKGLLWLTAGVWLAISL